MIGTSAYSSLNGLGLITGTTSGYNNYSSGIYGSTGLYNNYSMPYSIYSGGFGNLYANENYVENTKNSYEGMYDINKTAQSYQQKDLSQGNTLAKNCQTIKNLLEDGRTDAAIDEYNEILETLSSYQQYQGYSEDDIKTKIEEAYLGACDTTLQGDIAKYADSSFVSGLKNSNPLTVWFTQTNDAKDFKSKVIEQPKAGIDTALKVGGAAVGGAATFGVLGAKHIAKKGTEAIAKDGVTGLLSKAATYAKSSKWTLALGAFVGVICVGLKYWLNKNKTTDSAQTAS